MCIICVQYEQGRLTAREAVKNMNELTVWDDHLEKLMHELTDSIEMEDHEAHQEELLSQLYEQPAWEELKND